MALAAIGEKVVAEELSEGMLDRGLTAQGEILCRTLRPKFIEEADYHRLLAESRTALDLIGRAELEVRSDPSLRHALFGSHPYAALIEGHLDHDIECVGRFDAMIDACGTVRFIEYNAGMCGGAFSSEGVADVFEGSALLARVRDDWNFQFVGLRERYLRALVEGFRLARGRAPQNIVAVVPPGERGAQLSQHHELKSLVEFVQGRGVDARFAQLTDLLEVNGSLRDHSGAIDLAIVVDWASTLAACPLDHRLWQSRATDGTWISNSLGASVLRGGKHLFAVLSDPAYDLPLRIHERVWVGAHIPWSRILVDGSSMVGADSVELLDWVRTNQRTLVIKPCFSMGGEGVVLGWECNQEAWARAIADALLTPSIVQERVAVHPETYPVATGRRIARRRLSGDVCIYAWQATEVGGLYCRLSESGPLNLRAPAATLVPAFVFARER